MEALRIISDEHQALASILHAIRFMLKEVGAGRLAPVSAQAAADFQAAQAVRLGLEAAQQMPTASNAMVLAPQRTREGALLQALMGL